MPEPAGEDWLNRFEIVWNEAVANEIAGDDNPNPQGWPSYGRRKAATRRLAREVCLELADPEIVVAVEESLQTADGKVKGKPDLIIRSPDHEIRDYKTGSILEYESDNPKGEYVTQLLLYAVLEYENTGSWPSKGRLIPLKGKDAEVEIDPTEARRVEAEARAALDRYNSVVSGGDPLTLANPSSKNCRYCDYASECPAFWDAISPAWADEERSVLAAAGIIVERTVSKRGRVSVSLEEVRGSVPESKIRITGIASDQSFEIWTVFAAVGLRSGVRGEYEVTNQTRVKVC